MPFYNYRMAVAIQYPTPSLLRLTIYLHYRNYQGK